MGIRSDCGSRNDDWLSEMVEYEMPLGYAIGLKPDSTVAFRGCANYGIENVPTDSDYVSIWTSDWDHYWAGAIREDGSVTMWGRDLDGNLDVPEDLGPVERRPMAVVFGLWRSFKTAPSAHGVRTLTVLFPTSQHSLMYRNHSWSSAWFWH